MSNRSGSPYSAPRDANHVPLLIAASTADGVTPVVLEADPSTHALVVSGGGSGGGGTQYTDGAAAATHPIGTQPVFTNGSNIVTAVSTANPLPITGTISVGSTTDESAFTAGTSTTGPIAGVFNDSVASLTSGQQGTIRSTSKRAIHTNLRDNSGNETGTATTPLQVSLANTAANATAIKVDGSAVTQPISGTVTANAGTNLNTSALALETGGNLAAIATNTGNGATSANQTNGTQQTKITDGTNVATVKAASTAAVATDTAVVVAISPNNTVPVSGSGNFTVTQATAASLNATVVQGTATNLKTQAENYQGGTAVGSGNPLQVTLANTGANATAVKVDGSAVTQPISYSITGSGTATGALRVEVANNGTGVIGLNAGSNLVGKVGIDQTTPGTTNAVVDTPVTSGGLSIVTGSVGGTATAIKASAGQLYGYHLFNTTAAVAYVQIFNVASGSVTVGTTAPTISIGIPASGGVTVNFDKGVAFGTAISFACTTTRTGATGATCDVNFFYK